MRIGAGRSCERKDPFRDSEIMGAVECRPAREDKSSIKYGLLSRIDNKSKRRSTQIFFNSFLTIFWTSRRLFLDAIGHFFLFIQHLEKVCGLSKIFFQKWLILFAIFFLAPLCVWFFVVFFALPSRVRRLFVRWCASKFWRPPSQFVRYSVEREMRYNQWDS